MRRSNNQDAHIEVQADSPERFIARGHLFVVADGMGAHAAGELASRIATEQIPLFYLRDSTADPIEALRHAVQQANREIHQRGQQNHEFHNMGTTASTLAILADGAIIGHVGDSRVYRLRGQKLEQLTFDHSLVWEMQAAGQVKLDSQLGGAIPKNIITRSLGPSPTVAVDIEGPFPVQSGDRFLLCSDGLSGQIDDDELAPLLAELPPRTAARLLVDLANLRGGPDNITVTVVEVLEHRRPEGEQRLRVPPQPPPLVAAAAGFCLLCAALLGYFGQIGPMIVALILAAIAAAVEVAQRRQTAVPKRQPDPAELPKRRGPYRSVSAKPTAEISGKLESVQQALRQAAEQRQWTIDWKQIEAVDQQIQQLRNDGRIADAIRLQAEAIIKTMQQLRSQQRGSERLQME